MVDRDFAGVGVSQPRIRPGRELEWRLQETPSRLRGPRNASDRPGWWSRQLGACQSGAGGCRETPTALV